MNAMQQLLDKGFTPSDKRGVILERSAEYTEHYKHRGSPKTRVLYTLELVRSIDGDTVTGSLLSNWKPGCGLFTKHVSEI